MALCAPQERTEAQGTFLALRSLGGLVAPPLGGWLYMRGGFALPFVAFAAFLVAACLPVLSSVLRAPPAASEPAKATDTRSILRVPHVRRLLLTMTTMAACMSFPAAFWAPYLKGPPFGLNEARIGFVTITASHSVPDYLRA